MAYLLASDRAEKVDSEVPGMVAKIEMQLTAIKGGVRVCLS